MLTVEELFRKLSYAELSNLSVGNSGNGTIKDSEQRKIITYINDGLRILFTKYIMKIKKLDDTLSFTEPNDYSNLADLVRILTVQDINKIDYAVDLEDVPGLRITPFNRIEIDPLIIDLNATIIYQALHDKLDLLGTPVLTLAQEIRIPYFLEKPLQSFVASEYFKNMGGENGVGMSQQHFASYAQALELIDNKGLAETEVRFHNNKLDMRGYV